MDIKNVPDWILSLDEEDLEFIKKIRDELRLIKGGCENLCCLLSHSKN